MRVKISRLQYAAEAACLLAAVALLLTLGCARSPMMKFSLDTPAAALVPIRSAGIADGRARFREIFCAVQRHHGHLSPDNRSCESALHHLRDELDPCGKEVYLGDARLPVRLVLVSGLLNECTADFVSLFSAARPHVEKMGFKTDLILVGGLAGIRRNADRIRDAVADLKPVPGEKMVLLGYSKGAADLLEAVVRHPEVSERAAAVVSLAGAINGSPHAAALPGFTEGLLEKLFSTSCPDNHGEAIHDLRRSERLAWLTANPLPPSIRYYSVGAFADRGSISLILKPSYDRLAAVDPHNDGQMISQDMLIPGSTLLGFLNADHWAVALPLNRDHPRLTAAAITRNAYPREVLLETIARYIEEDLLGNGEQP